MAHHSHYVRHILGRLSADPAATVLVRGNERITAGALARSVAAAAGCMRRRGVGVESVVALLTNPNTPATLVLRYAANLLGATAVHIRGVNPAHPDDELPVEAQRGIVADTRPMMLAVDGDNVERARTLCGRLPDRPLLAALGDFGAGVIDLTAASGEPFDLDTAREGRIAVVTFTSGSTGKPKGVSWSFEVRNKMASFQLSRKVPAANFLVTAPLTHASGFIADETILTGGRVTLHHGFDPGEVLRAIGEHRISRLVLGPPQVYALARHPGIEHTDLSSVKELLYTGGPASPEQVGEALKVLGPVLVQVYGTSEAGLISMLFPPEHLDPELRTTVGRPPDLVRVTIRDPQDGRVLPAGQHGEVWVRNPWSMAGYWNEPELTADAVRDGWVRTGDLGHLDHAGYLHLHGRVADVMKVNGIKIRPDTVERALLAHPAVAQAAVFAVEDADRIERIHAAVVPRGDVRVDRAALQRHVGTTLPANHVPAEIELRTSLPLIGVAKPDRARLRTEARSSRNGDSEGKDA